MRWDCGPTPKEKYEAISRWHRWFAWHPTRIGSHDCRWLEYIERKGTIHCGGGYCVWSWDYRPLQEQRSGD